MSGPDQPSDSDSQSGTNQKPRGEALAESIKDFANAHFRGGLVPKDVDRDLYETIRDSTGGGKLLNVRPYPDNRGIEAGEELLMALHNLKLGWLGYKNTSSSDTFEMWFNDGKIEFMFYVDDEEHEQKLRTQIRAFYPNAKIEEKDSQFPTLRKRDYVAGCELNLKKSKYIPIRSDDRKSVYDFDSDPYTSITSDLVGPERCRTMIQVVFRPAHHEWTEGGPLKSHMPTSSNVEAISEGLQSEKYLSGFFNTEKRKPTQNETQLANYVVEQRGRPGYHVNIRIVSFSPYKAEAKSKVWSVAKSFEQSYLGGGDQTLVQSPKNGKKLVSMLKNMANRKWVDQDMIMMVPEVAGIAHLPNEEINAPEVDWFPLESGDGVPSAAPRYNRGRGEVGNTFEDEGKRTTSTRDALVNIPSLNFRNSTTYALLSGGLKTMLSVNKLNYVNDPDTDEADRPSEQPPDEDSGVEYDPEPREHPQSEGPDSEIVPDEEVNRDEFVAEDNVDLEPEATDDPTTDTDEQWDMDGVDPVGPTSEGGNEPEDTADGGADEESTTKQTVAESPAGFDGEPIGEGAEQFQQSSADEDDLDDAVTEDSAQDESDPPTESDDGSDDSDSDTEPSDSEESEKDTESDDDLDESMDPEDLL